MNQTNKIRLEAEISATSKGLVDALNQASSAVNSTSESWKSKFDKLKDSTSVISQGVKNLGDLMKNAGEIDPSNMQAYNAALGEVSASFGKVKGEVDAFVQALSAMKIEASNLGMPIEEYQAFADAVKASGVNMQEAQNMLAAMQSNIQDFANGVPQAESLFSKLGVTLEQVSSNTVGANFQLLVNALNDTIPASERATQNMQLFKSSIDSTLQVAQQYQKTVSEQTNAYATDKEVQNAISLASAIEKLGGQLANLQSGEKAVVAENERFAVSVDELFDKIKTEKNMLTDLGVTYDNYVNSLKSSVTSTINASSALQVLADKAGEMYNTILELRTDGLPMPDSYGNSVLGKLLDFVKEKKVAIAAEMTAVHGIMNQRIKAGAPIDMTELDKAVEHIGLLKNAVDKMYKIESLMPLSQEHKDALADVDKTLASADKNFKELSLDAQKLNNDFNFLTGLEQKVEKFKNTLGDAVQKLHRGEKVKVDTKEIDFAIEKLRKLKDEGKAGGYEHHLDALNGVKKAMSDVNSKSESWLRILRRVGSAISSAYRRIMGYKDGVKDAKKESEGLGTTLIKGIGQMMGMGSAVAVVTLAMRNLVKLAKEYVKELQEANKELTYGNLGANAESMSAARSKNDKRNEELISKLKEYSDLVKSERSNPSNEAMAKRRNLQDELNKLYGMSLNADNRGDIDAQIGRELDKLTQARIKAIDAQIKANQKVSDGVDKFIDGMQGFEAWGDMLHGKNWMGYIKQVGYTFTGDINGSGAIKEAQERSNKAKEETNALMEQRHKLEREDLRKQYDRLANAKDIDEVEKKRKDAEQKAADALEEANKKLEAWKNSLTDNDRQKALREIMGKYDEAVREGVSLEDAKNVATLAIAKMLQKEEEDERKKNKELLDAINQRIDAYKSAYKEYLDAEKAVRDAKKAYARTQQDIARDERADAIARRRERVQRQLSRFGFQTYAGFDLGEKSSERRERRRNAQLDASIADKLAKSQAGERVHFSHAEKERLGQYEQLKKQDKRLEASQKAMEAADKQTKAAEQLQEAAKAIKEAIYGRNEARTDLGKAGRELRQANSQRRRISRNDNPDQIFENARRTMTARGVAGAYTTKSIDYSAQIGQLHTDLQNLNKRVFVVR